MSETKLINKKEKATSRHWKNFLDKDYLGSHNLEAGEEMLLTIDKFIGEEKVKTGDGEKVKIVLYFKEDVPKMIMNITNGNTISNLYGSHPDGWIGKQIQVYSASVKAFGKTQDAIRVRDFVPKIAVNVNQYKLILDKAVDLKDLGAIWSKLPLSVKGNKEIEAHKDILKSKFTTPE